MAFQIPSFIDRYFTRQYAVDILNKPNEDHSIFTHSNGICVLALAPSHPVRREISIVKSVDFKVSEKVDRLENKVSGKSKRGAQFLVPDSPVCRIFCGENGDVVYTIRACVKGRLIEVNERLIKEPQLIVTKPETLGYVCVILQQRPRQNVEGQSIETPSKNKLAINLIDRFAYMRLRFPDNCEDMEMSDVLTNDDDD